MRNQALYISYGEMGIIVSYNQLTVMCTTHGKRRLISIRCQKEFLESKWTERMTHVRTDGRFDRRTHIMIIVQTQGSCKHSNYSADQRVVNLMFHE